MTKDLRQLENKNADKFSNLDYLHGFRFGVLEGYDEGYSNGAFAVIDDLLERVLSFIKDNPEDNPDWDWREDYNSDIYEMSFSFKHNPSKVKGKFDTFRWILYLPCSKRIRY